jgi:hypothetical protein
MDLWRTRNWKDPCRASLAVIDAMNRDRGTFTPARLHEYFPGEFLAINDLQLNEVLVELSAVLDGLTIDDARLLIPIEEIDSFERVADVTVGEVTSIGQRIDLPECKVKEAVIRIIGEPYSVNDWGGERDDIFSTRVILGGQRVSATFLLKGRGLRGPLRIRSLGKNGDQVVRMATQPADLLVVQHVDRIDPAVHEHLQDAVRRLRAHGNSGAVGSVWDGVDTIRLLVAYGIVDSTTGAWVGSVMER